MNPVFSFLIIVLSLAQLKTNAQGCVAIKGTTGVCGRPADAKGWELNLNNRYFKSYKHFVGTEEQKERIELKSNVINYAYELDITTIRTIDLRWSLAMTLPIMNFKRTSLYEHDGKTRNATHTFGIGDARVSAFRWMFDPTKSHKGNVQLGLGIKLPTGSNNAMDYFYKKPDSSVLGPVDQSIQPGDGGTGVTIELNSFYNFMHKLGVYGSIFYLVNPKEVNGTSTARGSAASATAKQYNTDVMSVPDLFMIRAGFSYMVNKFTFAGGVRVEGLPSSDLLGGDRGFRRPGYIISAEPSVTLVTKRASFNLTAPVALQRNRTQSNSDKRRTADIGYTPAGGCGFCRLPDQCWFNF